MALGMAFVIITGQIDLSIGSALVLCTGVTIMTFNVTNSIPLMILAALASGALCGAVNGVLVGCAKMPPFVVTLGTMLIYRSLTLSVVRSIDPAISGSSSSQFAMISDNSNYEFLRMKFGTGKLALGSFSIPYITFVFVLMVIIFVIIANRTKYGKSVRGRLQREERAPCRYKHDVGQGLRVHPHGAYGGRGQRHSGLQDRQRDARLLRAEL